MIDCPRNRFARPSFAVRSALAFVTALSFASFAAAQDQGQQQVQQQQAQQVEAPQALIGPFDLRPQWTQGQTSRYESWAQREQTQTISFGGREQTGTTTMVWESEYIWVVDEAHGDGSYTCTMTIDWMSVTVTGPQGEQQVIDSRKGSADNALFHELLRAISGVPITVEVAANGSITDVAGVDAIRRKMSEPELAPEELDFIESATELAVLSGAPAALEVGESWREEYRWTHSLPVPGAESFINQDMRYTLQSVENVAGIPLATVATEADLELEVDKSDVPDEAPPMDIRLRRGSYEGQVLFDLARHEAVGRNGTQRDTVVITIRGPRGSMTNMIETSVQSQILRIEER